MNIKKYLLSFLAATLCTAGFAYPAPQDDSSTQQLLQQYAAQAQELQKNFDQKLLPVLKKTAQFALQVQQSGQNELTSEQEQLFDQYGEKLDAALTQLVAPAIAEIDIAQFNQEYKKIAQAYSMPQQQFTEESLTELFKGMYLVSALTYFEQSKKMSQEEVGILLEILLPQEGEE